MNVTFEDKDKSVVDGVHNYFRDVDANEVKRAVNSKLDADKLGTNNGVAPLGPDGKIPPQYIATTATAVAVPFAPAGNIAATNVQAAIEELDAEKQPLLGFNPENVGNKATNLSENTSNTKYPTVKATVDGDAATLAAAQAYADLVSTSALNFRGYFDPTGATVYPTTGGTGTAGAIEAGNTWEISVAIAANTNGIHPAYDVGDLIVAKIGTPGQTAANWGRTAHNTTQATELARGTAMLSTQAEIEDNSTPNDIDIVTPLKFWYGITKFLTLAWTFVQKITFTAAPRFSSVTASQYLKVDATKDLTSVATIPGADVDAATDSARGSVELATSTEVRTGTDTARAVTPAGVAARINKLPVMEFAADYISGSNLTLSGLGQVAQGDLLTSGKVIVCNGQVVPTENGIYIVDAGAWLRIGVTYNNDVYNYAGNFEGARIFVRKNKKFYNQVTLTSELATIGQVWVESAAAGGAVEVFVSDFTVVLSGGKTFGKYTNGQIVPSSGKTPMQVLLDVAIEYLLPAFNAFAMTGQATQVEVGFTITAGGKTFTWGTTNPGNIKPNIIKIKNQTAGTDLATALANNGTESGVNIPAPIQLNAGGASQVFRIEAENTQNTVFTRDLTITAAYLRFYGTPATDPANSADVRALSNSTFGNTFNINIAIGQQKICFAYEDTRPDITDGSVKYVEGFNSNVGNTFTKFTFNVNDAGGTPRGYKIYIATLGAPASSVMTYAVTIP